MNKVCIFGPRHSRRPFWCLLVVLLVIIIVLLWGSGLVCYATSLPQKVESPHGQSDAIVVLTGGSRRIATGLELLAKGQGKKLFISGVYQGLGVQELLDLFQLSPQNPGHRIVLGYQAGDTQGNAMESAEWIAKENIQSIRLVTAAYHMPRSLMEFRNLMPELTITPHPVFPEHVKHGNWWRQPGSAILILSEYGKYLLTKIRIFVMDLF